MPLGIYISVPFCRSKCSYCNFANGVFSPVQYSEYCKLLRREVEMTADETGLRGAAVDTVYWGGGTPSLLPAAQIAALIGHMRDLFSIAPAAEFTIEAAPGTLSDPILEAFVSAGVTRVSLGVQSFVDQEARAVARLHTSEVVWKDIERLRAAGIANINVDLIAGLPHQTAASWQQSLSAAIATGVPHVSVYMLEVDEDSRLGNELIAGGARYHAHHVPDDDLIADFYEAACEQLEAAGLRQYEISNFARLGFVSRHNERYWLRQPYLGFGVDAHSMVSSDREIRRANYDTLEEYLAALRSGRLPRAETTVLTEEQQLEETLFLGLRRTEGIDLERVRELFGNDGYNGTLSAAAPALDTALLEQTDNHLRLTARGRMLSNEVFSAFIGLAGAVVSAGANIR